MPPHAITALGVARTFQNQRLFNQMTRAGERAGRHALPHAARARRASCWACPARAPNGGASIERGKELLAFFGDRLLPRAQDPPRRLVVREPAPPRDRARARHQPKLLLLDEPAAGMNPTEKRELMQDIERIRARGVTVLLIEHDMGLVQGICERVVVLDHGVKIAEGSFQEVRRNPAVLEAYLGRRHA